MSRQIAIVLALVVAVPLGAATRNNDDTCDVGLYPAATLLLPYFEVDLQATRSEGQRTVFTVTNTGAAPQAARVTLWTDLGYPVISFNLYLTGYDVQKVDLFDVIGRGIIAQDGDMGLPSSPLGDLSDDDNPRLDEVTCSELPRVLPRTYVDMVRRAFTEGSVPQVGERAACDAIGNQHSLAVGYATIDVVALCSASTPLDPSYFSHELRFDNVLIGDFVQVHGENDSAQGSPMVHIRAIPEGGQMATRRRTNLSDTFYSRLQPQANRTGDGRQPLPSTFAVRWIEGGRTGFQTDLKLWRESAVGSGDTCAGYAANAALTYEAVRFDEDENADGLAPDVIKTSVWPVYFRPPTSRTSTKTEFFPPDTSAAPAGWMYLNLDGDPTRVAGAARKFSPRQGWVTATMKAEGRFSVDIDAVALGNGCSPKVGPSMATWVDSKHIIGPSSNATP